MTPPHKKPPRRIAYTLEQADATLREAGIRSSAEVREEESEHKARRDREVAK